MTTTAFSPRGKYQNRGSGFVSQVHLLDEVGQQPLLLVGLRDRDLVQVDPVGLDVTGLSPKNRSSERDRRRDAVALVAGPGRVALARVDDRPREVVGEGRGLTAVRADAAQGHGRIRGRGGALRVERRERGRAVERVPIGGAVELDRLADDARRRAPARVST